MIVVVLALVAAYLAVGAAIGLAYAVRSYRKNADFTEEPLMIAIPTIATFLVLLAFWPLVWAGERFIVFIKHQADAEEAEEDRKSANERGR